MTPAAMLHDCEHLTITAMRRVSWVCRACRLPFIPAPDAGQTADPLDVERLGLSAEQTAILRDHLASRQQTVAEFFGDVLMEYGLGRATGKDYPPADIDGSDLADTGEPDRA